ncbi:hypothetical protein [Mycobacterium colombiense]|uniref:hypothetical protein n=1 Tax=Mycobacterium colombiense TaxID=339268 RepID=UPI000A82E778|nr:hypothetical protein [Mycobacterium colombiense]
MLTVWLYRFKAGTTASTLNKLRLRGPERVYPGVNLDGGTFFGRCWSHPLYTHGSVFTRNGIADARKETADMELLKENLRILSPSLAAMEVRNLIPNDDPELVELGDNGWHEQMSSNWVEAASSSDEVEFHLNTIGLSCLNVGTFPPYTILELWRQKRGRPYEWFGSAPAPRAA